MSQSELRLEAMCDFIDDVGQCPVPVTVEHIDDMMRSFRDLGIRRVSWAYYADERGGHVVPFDPASDLPSVKGFTRYVQTYRSLGNPLRAAVEAGHRHGIEVYAYFKPYETGGGLSYPDGSPEARAYGKLPKVGGQLVWFDPFVVDHPDLRIQRRTDDVRDDLDRCPICTIVLRKTDAAPTRIGRQNLQIWVSETNYRYQRLNADFTLEETVEAAAQDVVDLQRNTLTSKGDPVRTLTLSGLNLTQACVLVTTDFTDGEADFGNTAIDMMRVYDGQDRELLGVYSNGSGIYNSAAIDFRNWGLMYDHGYGCRASSLDNCNSEGRDGLIAFARGRSAYLDGALCETHPQVQAFWLDCLRAMVDAGVDGVDFRIENHSTMTDFTEDYGYNQVILDQLADPRHPDQREIAKVRGDAYTEFLRRSKELLARHGRQMRINFQMDVLRPEIPRNRLLAYPANVEFQWERWVDEGLLDEAIFRFFALEFDEVLDEEIGRQVIERCQESGYPVVFNRYINQGDLVEEFGQIQGDGRFRGFILYEVANFADYGADGTCRVSDDRVLQVATLLG